jgi:hypothetical protein
MSSTSNHDLAMKLFPQAADYSPYRPTGEQRTYGTLANQPQPAYDGDLSAGFDYASITLLDCTDRANLRADVEARKLPIARRSVLPGKKNSLVVSGGNWAENSRVSAADVRRVARLYPGTPTQQDKAKQLEQLLVYKANIPPYVKDLLLVPNPVDVVGPDLKPMPRGGAEATVPVGSEENAEDNVLVVNLPGTNLPGSQRG